MGPKNDSLAESKNMLKKSTQASCTFDGDEKSFTNIDMALNACSRSNECFAIHDRHCDGKEEFKVCKDQDKIISEKTSCIYKKQGDGNIGYEFNL